MNLAIKHFFRSFFAIYSTCAAGHVICSGHLPCRRHNHAFVHAWKLVDVKWESEAVRALWIQVIISQWIATLQQPVGPAPQLEKKNAGGTQSGLHILWRHRCVYCNVSCHTVMFSGRRANSQQIFPFGAKTPFPLITRTFTVHERTPSCAIKLRQQWCENNWHFREISVVKFCRAVQTSLTQGRLAGEIIECQFFNALKCCSLKLTTLSGLDLSWWTELWGSLSPAKTPEIFFFLSDHSVRSSSQHDNSCGSSFSSGVFSSNFLSQRSDQTQTFWLLGLPQSSSLWIQEFVCATYAALQGLLAQIKSALAFGDSDIFWTYFCG